MYCDWQGIFHSRLIDVYIYILMINNKQRSTLVLHNIHISKKWLARGNIHSHINMYICTPTYIHIYIQAHLYTYIHTYMHTYIHTYIHTDRQTYVHIYIHISINHLWALVREIDLGLGVRNFRRENCDHWYLSTYRSQ